MIKTHNSVSRRAFLAGGAALSVTHFSVRKHWPFPV